MASNNVVRVQSTSTFSRFVFPPAPPTGETYNGFGQGSGVLISPVLYLTAAHVLDWLADRQGPFDQFLGSSFSVQSGPVPANQPAYQHDLTAANFFRGYVLGAGVRVADPTDVALVRLSSPTGLTGEDVAFFVDRPTQTTALITGYPSSADPDGNTQTDSSVTVLAARGNGVLDLSSGPGKGASGGAIFMDIGPNNDRAVVGVYTERSSSADPNHHGVYLRYQDLQNIRSTLEAAEQGFGPAALPRIHIVGSQRGDIIRGTHRNEVLYGDAGADIIYTGHMPLNPVTPNLIYPGPGADIVIVGNGVTVIEEEENSPEFDRLAILLEAIAPNMTVAGPEEDVAAEQILVLRGGAYLVGNAGEVGGDGVYYTSERPDGSNALGTNLFVRVDFDLPAGILPGASNGSPHLFITITIYRNGPNGRETVGESGVIVENFQSGDFGLTFINIGIVDIEAWDDFSSDLLTPTLQAIPDIDFAQNDDPTDVNGTSGADVLTGTIESESLFGQGGNDSISGLAGHDVMIGGDGNDTLSGDDGRDAIQGDAGDDALNGGAGDDIIEGGAGNDAMDGGAGGDTYAFFAGSGNDTITENPDGGAIDRVQITGLNPANVILRQSSNNLLVTIAHTSEELTILGHFASMSSGIELLVFADGTTWDRGQIGSNLWTGGTSGDDTLTGTSGDDFLQGLAGNDSVSGGDGNDVLEGNGENDVLSGGAGNDTLRGNAGNDTYNGGSGTDTVVLDGTRAAWTPGVGSGLYTLYNGTLGTDSYATDVEFVTFSDTTIATPASVLAPDGVLWRHTATGQINIGYNDLTVLSSAWTARTGDFDADNDTDIMWHNTSNYDMVSWEMEGGLLIDTNVLPDTSANYTIAAVGDFNGDGYDDLLWRNVSTEGVVTWSIEDMQFDTNTSLPNVGAGWQMRGTGDFDGDGDDDLLWHNTGSGAVVSWEMQSGNLSTTHSLGTVNGYTAHLGGDFNNDGDDDIFWRHDAGSSSNVIWSFTSDSTFTTPTVSSLSTAWSVAGIDDFNDDGTGDILWMDTSGALVTWQMSSNAIGSTPTHGTARSGWTPLRVGEFEL